MVSQVIGLLDSTVGLIKNQRDSFWNAVKMDAMEAELYF